MTVIKWSGHESRILRQALRLSVREFAEDLGISPRTVSKWEAAGAALSPRPELQRALDTRYRRASDEERTRFNDTLGRAGSGTDDTAVSDTGVALVDSAAETAAFAVWWEATSTGPVDAEILFSELRRLAAEYLSGSPEPVVRALRDLRNCVFRLLRGHQSPSRARDLHLAAGYTCVLLAWLSGDLSHHGAADTHARAGALFADTSGSTELRAWVQAVRSKTSFWLGDYRIAAAQATTGLDSAPTTGVRVLLAAQAADACAALGASAPARAALADVVAAREALREGDTIGGLLSCSKAREANYVSGVHQRLGAADQAVTTADEALELSLAQPVRSYATEAQIRLNRVSAFLRLGDLETASEALRPVLELPLDRRLDTLTRRVAGVGETLAGPRFARSRTARTLLEDVESFAVLAR